MIKLIHPENYPNGISFGDKPMTVLELHRAIQEQQDDAINEGDDRLDITDRNPSVRITDYIIKINEPYYLTDESFKLLNEGAIKQLNDQLWSTDHY